MRTNRLLEAMTGHAPSQEQVEIEDELLALTPIVNDLDHELCEASRFRVAILQHQLRCLVTIH